MEINPFIQIEENDDEVYAICVVVILDLSILLSITFFPFPIFFSQVIIYKNIIYIYIYIIIICT